jgi:hypothetical protein
VEAIAKKEKQDKILVFTDRDENEIVTSNIDDTGDDDDDNDGD